MHIPLKKIKLSTPIKEAVKTKAPKVATSKSSSEATQAIDNDSKHSANSEKRFKTKAEMKVCHCVKDCIVYSEMCVICLGLSCHSRLPNSSSGGSNTKL